MKLEKESQQQQLKDLNLLPSKFQHNYYAPKELMKKSRKMSSIKGEKIRNIMWTPRFRDFWDKTQELVKRDPLFQHCNSRTVAKQDQRNNANYVFTKTWKNFKYNYETYKKDPNYMISAMISVGFMNMSAGTKVGVHFGLYTKTLLALGTQKHEKWIPRAFELEDYGCFMLTEMGHGSNVQGIVTTATYDHSTRSFILNTPVDMGMKFWIGNLAQTANMGVLFANLLVDGRNEGVHAFLIKIRDDDGNVSPGLIVGDCGMKMGINGVDNGWAMFRSMRVSVDALLNKFSWITEDGSFKSKIKSKTKRFAVQISALSGGRLGVAVSGAVASVIGCSLAIRYGTVRKQFGQQKGMENSLMEYPLVYSKLITRICNSLVFDNISNYLDNEWNNVDVYNLGNIKVKELHAMSSFIKAASTWNMKASLLKARELCGGHAFSAYSYLPTLLNDPEVHITWEGTNEVLLQQTCKNLLEEFNVFKTKGKINYKSLLFLKKFEDDKVDLDGVFNNLLTKVKDLKSGAVSPLFEVILEKEVSPSMSDLLKTKSFLESLLNDLELVMQLRLYEMVDKSLAKFAQFLTQVKSTQNNFFRSFNKTLPHVLFPTSIFYGELTCFSALKHHISFIGNPNQTPFLFKEVPHFRNLSENDNINEKIYFLKTLVVFAASTLANSAEFLVGSHESVDPSFFDGLHEIVLKLTSSMKFDALTIGDLYVPEHIRLSSIGPFDGDIYKSLQTYIFENKNNFGKSPQWEDVRKMRIENSRKS
jgi:acyl-CoA oxidase